MFSLPLNKRCTRYLCASGALLTLGIPGVAAATGNADRPQLSIASPRASTVSGQFVLAAGGVGSRAQRIVFSVDGRAVLSATRTSSHALPLQDTLRLSDGRHLLSIRVYYPRIASQVASKAITVHTVSVTPPSPAPVGESNGSTGTGTTSGTGTTTTGTTTTGTTTGTTTTGTSTTPGTTAPTGTTASATPTLAGFVGATPTAGASVANFNREAYQYTTTWTTAQEAGRYQFMVIPGNEYRLIPQLKAENPNLKFLLYQSLMHTNANDYSYDLTVTGCTAEADDAANHPSWFLYDQSGNRVLSRGHTSALYLVDVGNPDYQKMCAANAAAQAKKYGFDGIFWDAVDGSLRWSLNSGISVPKYPTDATWQAAMTSAVSYIGPALRAQGLISIGNVAGANGVSGWEQWVGSLDGAEEESWTDGGEGLAQQIPFWSQKFAEAAWAAANGKYELMHTYNGTEAANTFGLAAMMLIANGKASFATSSTNYINNENWFSEYSLAQGLGAPAGAYRILPNGVYERPFSNGIVLVNPTGNSIPAFSLGGVYSGSGLTGVSQVAMGPTSGLILQKVG